jgi:hypothetical protein
MSIAPPHHTMGQEGRTDSWITPKWIIDRLGPFDLDPCASAPQPWPCASRSYVAHDDGLSKPWDGFVWLNPPYGNGTSSWLKKMAEHGNGIALVFARIETQMFFSYVWPVASAILVLRGRLTFFRPDGSKPTGNSGGPSILVAYGDEAAKRIERLGDVGTFVPLRHS